MNNLQPPDDAPESTNMVKAILWGILICGTLYFSYGIAYFIGYDRGMKSVKIDKAVCMSEIIKYSNPGRGR
jgi:hypothetical protein